MTRVFANSEHEFSGLVSFKVTLDRVQRIGRIGDMPRPVKAAALLTRSGLRCVGISIGRKP